MYFEMNWRKIIRFIGRVTPSLLLVVIAIPILLVNNKNGDYCVGMIQAVAIGFLGTAYCIWFLVLFIIYGWLTISRKKPYNYFPLIVTAILFLLFFIVTQNREEEFKENNKMELANQMGDMDSENNIYLMENGEFMFVAIYVEATCYDFGKFEIIGDTLKFDNLKVAFKDTILDKMYIYHKKEKCYKPVTDSCESRKFLMIK